MRRLAENDAKEIEKEFLTAKRHSIEVHYHSFLYKLKKELKKAT